MIFIIKSFLHIELQTNTKLDENFSKIDSADRINIMKNSIFEQVQYQNLILIFNQIFML